jgi:ADP-heptose:LPS heptosyltransferase
MSRLAARLKRFVTLTRAVYADTGSRRQAAAFAVKFFLRKLPTLITHVWHPMPGHTGQRAKAIRSAKTPCVPLLAINVSGGIGDYVVAARFLRDFCASIEPCRLFLYANSPPHAEWLFANLPGYQASYAGSLFDVDAASYDLAVSVNSLVTVRPMRLTEALRESPKLLAARAAIWRHQKPLTPFIDYHPRLANGLARIAVFTGFTRRDFLHHCAEVPYGGDALDIEVASHPIDTIRGRAYVTIHNGFDQNFVITGTTATKCYPHFDAVVAGIKRAFPDLLIVQIGINTSKHLPSADIDCLNQTTLKEATEIIRGAVLHIDNEGGLVHIASSFGVKSCVVFGPTPSAYFGYPSNINVDPPVCGDCWWMTETWMSRCLKGYDAAPCLATQDPETIIYRVVEFLEKRNNSRNLIFSDAVVDKDHKQQLTGDLR